VTQIPLLDLAGWFDGDDDDRRRLADELDAHLQRLGFLVVVNHGVARDVIDVCRERCREFFHLPAGDKQPVAMSGKAYRGWVGPGLESNAATYGIDTPPDLKETFAFGPVDVVDETLRTSEPRWFSANIWPKHPAGFRDAAEAWWRAARALTDEVLDLCSLALRLPQSHLRDRSRATTAQVSLNWYGPRGTTEPEPDQFRIGPHTDFGTLTILDREPGAGGLQVLDEHGEWIDAPYVDGSLLINTGDLLRRWTNDRWESNQHRVLPPQESAPDEELISLVFFHEPDHEAWIEALPTCVPAGEAPRYPGVHAHDYLAEKMAALAVR
jgi:isopenicillin N synthase-like dioxygenase